MSEINQTLKDDGLILFYFSPSHKDAWNILLRVLQESKFTVTNLHSIHLENVTNVMPQLGVESLSTILIICRKRLSEDIVYYEDLISQIENQIKQRLEKISINELFSMQINDIFIISFNKILQTITKYSEIRSYEKNNSTELRFLIEQIQKYTALYLFNRISEKSIVILGNQIGVYLFLRAFYTKITSEEMQNICRYFGVKMSVLEAKKLVIKENDFYRLADLGEFPVDERPSDISSGDLYLQLCYCYQNLEQIKEKNISISKFENFKKDEILSTVKSLIQIKSILGQFDDEMVRLNSLLESEI